MVWSLNTGRVIRVLSGVHKNWVTAVAVVEPREPTVCSSSGDGLATNSGSSTDTAPHTLRSTPFIVTAGFDGVPVLWDLHSGAMISKLEGASGASSAHISSGGSGKSTKNVASSAMNTGSSGIRAVAVYSGVPLDRGRCSPLIFTAGHDGAVTQHDSFYPFRAMPPKSTVLALFHLDAQETVDKGWPRISALSARYAQCLWMENSELFVMACTQRRSDFLLKFQAMLGVMLPRMGNIIQNKTLLRFCIENKDLQCTRILLSAWSRLLNTAILSKMMIKVHPSMYLHPTELLLLGSVYPAEFTVFIRSIRLVLVDLNVSMCSNTSGSVTAGCTLQTVTDPYKQFDVSVYGDEHSVGQPVTLCYLPLHDAASLDMLYMYLQTSIALSSVEIFDTDVVIYALRYAWTYFAYNIHIRSTIMFALFIGLYTPTMLGFEYLIRSDDQNNVNFGWFLQTITFICFICRVAYSAFKTYKIVHTYNECVAYISDPWVVLDVLTQVLGIVGLVTRYVARGESDVSRSFLSLTTVLLWFRGLYYLRPFRSSGPLGEKYAL